MLKQVYELKLNGLEDIVKNIRGSSILGRFFEKVRLTVLYMKSSGFYALTFRFMTDP